MEVKNSTDWMEKSVKSMNITDRRVDRMKQFIRIEDRESMWY